LEVPQGQVDHFSMKTELKITLRAKNYFLKFLNFHKKIFKKLEKINFFQSCEDYYKVLPNDWYTLK